MLDMLDTYTHTHLHPACYFPIPTPMYLYRLSSQPQTHMLNRRVEQCELYDVLQYLCEIEKNGRG